MPLAFSIASVAAHTLVHIVVMSHNVWQHKCYFIAVTLLCLAKYGWKPIDVQTNKEHSRHQHPTQTKHIISMFCLPSCAAQILEKQAAQRMYTQ